MVFHYYDLALGLNKYANSSEFSFNVNKTLFISDSINVSLFNEAVYWIWYCVSIYIFSSRFLLLFNKHEIDGILALVLML